VVVTGADGFAGRVLVSALKEEGHEVSGWVRNPPNKPIAGVKYRRVDIRDKGACTNSMEDIQPHWVFHLAAMTHVLDCQNNPKQCFETNVSGTANVFGAMPVEARGLFSSSCHVYGRPKSLAICEDHPIAPVGVYAESKALGEGAVADCGKKVVIARAFHHTGLGQPERFVLSDWAQQIRQGAAQIHVGDLSLCRDFCDVRDIVRGYMVLLGSGNPGEAYNLASGEARSLETLFGMLRGHQHCEPLAQAERMRDGDVSLLCGDPSKAEALGWRRHHDLSKTLAEMAGR